MLPFAKPGGLLLFPVPFSFWLQLQLLLQLSSEPLLQPLPPLATELSLIHHKQNYKYQLNLENLKQYFMTEGLLNLQNKNYNL